MNVNIRNFRQRQAYTPTWEAMKKFSIERDRQSNDEIWLLEHPPVFTQGQSGQDKHILKISDIPIVHTDRGGQVTYHGPGQLIAYVLVDVKRLKLTIRQLVNKLERSVIHLLETYKIKAHADPKAPGVYVNEKKICSLGLRIKRGYSYHGLALNVDTDLKPFSWINPCGYTLLKMTNMSEYTKEIEMSTLRKQLCGQLIQQLGYTINQNSDELV